MSSGSLEAIIDKGLNPAVKMIKADNLPGVVSILEELGVGTDGLGDALFALARRLLADTCLGEARSVLEFLLAALDNNTQAAPVLQLLGDICRTEGNHEEARQYYGRMPVTMENIRQCCETFVPMADVDGLLALRDTITNGLEERFLPEIHAVIDDCMVRMGDVCRVDTEAVTERLQRNIEVVGRVYPFLEDQERFAALAAAVLDDASLVFFDSASRKYIRWDGVWQQAFCPPGREAAAAALVTEERDTICHCRSLTDLCVLLAALEKGTQQFIRSELLVVIDFSLLAVGALFCDLAPLLEGNYVVRLVDERTLESSLVRLLIALNTAFPSRHVAPGNDNDFFETRINPVLRACEQVILARGNIYAEELRQLYPPNFFETVKKKIANGDRLRILLKTSRYTTYIQYATRDMAEGFAELGHEVLVEKEEAEAGMGIRNDVALRNLVDFYPDLVFCIDHLRYEFADYPRHLPFVTWVQDPMEAIFKLNDPGAVARCDFLYSTCLLWDKMIAENSVFANHLVHRLHFPVNPRLYHPIDCNKRFDVTYIAHQEFPDAVIAAFSDRPDSALTAEELRHRAFLRFVDSLSMNEATHYFVKMNVDLLEYGREFIENFYRDASIFEPFGARAIRYYYKLYDTVLRCRLLAPLVKSGIDLKLFGKGWDRHPMFAPCAMGPVDNGEKLNRVINESRINLNLSPAISFHNKVAEVLGAGAFMLTRDIGEHDVMPLSPAFERDTEVVLFSTGEDLVDKVRYYLDHEDEREEIAARAHAKMMKDFSVKAAAAKIINDISRGLSVKNHAETDAD